MAPLVYFSGSISGGRDDLDHYRGLVAGLERRGVEVLAGQVTNDAIGSAGESLSPEAVFERDLAWLERVARSGGALVAEVTAPSHGVGYEIAAARYLYDIPVIALFRASSGRRCSAMIAGAPGVLLLEWEPERMDEVLDRVVAKLGENEPESPRRGRLAPFSGLQ
jgi:2'-deoxynucleoside 5'-phosphate N-hydrolase